MAATSFAALSVLRRKASPCLVSIISNIKLFHYRTLLSAPFITAATLSCSAADTFHPAQDIKGDIDGDKSATEAVKQIVELARQASSRREVLHTDFLTPRILKESTQALKKLTDVKTVDQGGYPQAERRRLSIGHPEVLKTDPDVISALSLRGNFGGQPCSHGDILDAILGTKISSEKLGDIILQIIGYRLATTIKKKKLVGFDKGEEGAQILVVPELVDVVTSALDKVGDVPVTCEKIPLLALEYESTSTETFQTVEESLRLDALASAGFKISRTKTVDLIKKGDVQINGTNVTKGKTIIKTGDIISVSGKGRVKVGEINFTKKGKFAIELIRYL